MIVTDSNFDEVIKSNPLVLVDFWAEWCGPCKKISPILDEISNEFNLPLAKLNVDDNLVKSKEFSISSIPTIILFENGIPIKTIIGAKPKHLLVKELEEWI
jgi:thioredoxin 1